MSLKVQFDERATSVIEFLRVANGMDTSTDVVQRALALFKVYTEARLRGDKVCIVSADEQSEREIV